MWSHKVIESKISNLFLIVFNGTQNRSNNCNDTCTSKLSCRKHHIIYKMYKYKFNCIIWNVRMIVG